MDNRHKIRGPTCQRAIKEENKVANCDLVDHQACSLLQYNNVISRLCYKYNLTDSWFCFIEQIRSLYTP